LTPPPPFHRRDGPFPLFMSPRILPFLGAIAPPGWCASAQIPPLLFFFLLPPRQSGFLFFFFPPPDPPWSFFLENHEISSFFPYRENKLFPPFLFPPIFFSPATLLFSQEKSPPLPLSRIIGRFLPPIFWTPSSFLLFGARCRVLLFFSSCVPSPPPSPFFPLIPCFLAPLMRWRVPCPSFFFHARSHFFLSLPFLSPSHGFRQESLLP